MAIEDLEQHGILLPENEWGTHKLETTTSEIPLLVIFLISVAGCALGFWGKGSSWTWTGIGVFFIAFFGIILLCDRAILKQRKRVKQERKEEKRNS